MKLWWTHQSCGKVTIDELTCGEFTVWQTCIRFLYCTQTSLRGYGCACWSLWLIFSPTSLSPKYQHDLRICWPMHVSRDLIQTFSKLLLQPRIAELCEIPQCFSITLHSETHVSDHLCMSWDKYPRHALSPHPHVIIHCFYRNTVSLKWPIAGTGPVVFKGPPI